MSRPLPMERLPRRDYFPGTAMLCGRCEHQQQGQGGQKKCGAFSPDLIVRDNGETGRARIGVELCNRFSDKDEPCPEDEDLDP